jgi:hypothetical protein
MSSEGENMTHQTDTITSLPNNAPRKRMEREQGRPVKRVLDQRSREVVGWLYQWNTGQFGIMWKAEHCDNVVYE